MTKLADDLREARRLKFVEAYALHGIIQPGLDAAGICRATYTLWRRQDEAFNEACDAAYQCAVDKAELELRTRAIEGTEEPVLYKGEPVWRRNPDTGDYLLDKDFNYVPFTISKKSDRLLEVYVRSHRPIYKERTEVALTGRDGGPVLQEHGPFLPDKYQQEPSGRSRVQLRPDLRNPGRRRLGRRWDRYSGRVGQDQHAVPPCRYKRSR